MDDFDVALELTFDEPAGPKKRTVTVQRRLVRLDNNEFRSDPKSADADSRYPDVHGAATDVGLKIVRGGEDLAELWLSGREYKDVLADKRVIIELGRGGAFRKARAPIGEPEARKPEIIGAGGDAVVFPIGRGSLRDWGKKGAMSVSLRRSFAKTSSAHAKATPAVQDMLIYPHAESTLVYRDCRTWRICGDTTQVGPERDLGLRYSMHMLEDDESCLNELLKANDSLRNRLGPDQITVTSTQYVASGLLGRKPPGETEADLALPIDKTCFDGWHLIEISEENGHFTKRRLATPATGGHEFRFAKGFESNAAAVAYLASSPAIKSRATDLGEGKLLRVPTIKPIPRGQNEAVGQWTVEFETGPPGSTTALTQDVYLHLGVDRQAMLLIDFGSFSRLIELRLHGNGKAGPEVHRVPVGPIIDAPFVSDHEGLSELVVSKALLGARRADFTDTAFRPETNQRDFGIPVEDDPDLVSLAGNAAPPPGVGGPADPNRCAYSPVFKSAVFRGDKKLRLPKGDGTPVYVDLPETFRSVFQYLLAEALSSDALKVPLARFAEVQLMSGSKSATTGGGAFIDEMVLGIVLTHPGFITFDTHRLLTNQVTDILSRFHLDGNLLKSCGLLGDPKLHIGLVRAFPEPVAAIMPVLGSVVNKNRPIASIDCGMRTFDLALLKPTGNPDHPYTLVECWGADLGGRRLDYALVDALKCMLLETLEGKQFADEMPTSDKELEDAFVAIKCAQSLRRYERMQSVLRSVEASKIALDEDTAEANFVIAERRGVESDSDWFDQVTTERLLSACSRTNGPGLRVHIDSAEQIVLSTLVQSLAASDPVKLYVEAVKAFCDSYLGETEDLDVRFCGRGAQAVFLTPLREWMQNDKGWTVNSLTEASAKSVVVDGAGILAKDHRILLTNHVRLRLSVLQLGPDDDILSVQSLDDLDAKEITAVAGCASVSVVPVCSAMARRMMARGGNIRWWYEALFLDGVIEDRMPVKPGERIRLERFAASTGSSGKSAFRHTAIWLQRDVIEWKATSDYGNDMQWQFISHGGLNQ
ncbi:MAG: hypothetical protein QNJ16_15450 [Rhodobacter sp.]|nr:hypothetical protein [Rhodobacter sp.]